ncbi:aldehyde ferredoxin oxidoreductase family protein [Thermosediminibacter litoriperuensis]|uniref:Aldehyde:ferredoxin oxidoreductase n=1 Tax=Thermosediminibacter litoriperuensis TaxID=291989 RepID=A0A5S5ACU3_9FIRM|nr:aldehyde ferredoxin oxidoreductase family protein [Thermosediminibacter litoriperuensis]TYP47448.1 aldehyde:ferredoxin oxidoreductase [Thermosediminibacter litoriperuensis]
MFGWTGTIIRVNLTDGSIKKESLNLRDAHLYLGGRGLGTKIIMDEIDPGINPLSPENKLIFMTGPLTGTMAACPGRYEVVAKAPLTGTIGAANSGGHFGPELKFAGYDGIIFEGRAEKPVYLWINDNSVELRPAERLWGKNTFETTDELLKETAEDARVACIGPAGEKMVLFATVMNDKHRAAGRSGMGAVMGSKNLKAVVVRGTRSVEVADPEVFYEVCTEARKKLKEHPVTGTGLPTYGTEILINVLNQVAALPTRNWRDGGYFEYAEEISGEALREKYLVRNKGCFGCSIGCGRVTRVPEGKYKGFGEGPEYEAGWALGANCGVRDLAAVCKANFICNELGLDPITMGCTIACTMEMYEKGIITKEEIGMETPFGSADAIVELTRMTGLREGFGDRLAEGSYRLASAYGHPELSMSVKKQEMPAYDARGVQGMGLEYATSNRGGCHVRGYMTSPEILGVPVKLDPLVTTDKAKWLKTFQDLTAVVDSAGICLFTTFAIGLPEISAMLKAAIGWDYSDEEVLKIGERIWNLERMFNIGAGFTKADDTLPPRLLNEPLKAGPGKGKVVELDVMLKEYYQLRGWDEDGLPTGDKLRELGIK